MHGKIVANDIMPFNVWTAKDVLNYGAEQSEEDITPNVTIVKIMCAALTGQAIEVAVLGLVVWLQGIWAVTADGFPAHVIQELKMRGESGGVRGEGGGAKPPDF